MNYRSKTFFCGLAVGGLLLAGSRFTHAQTAGEASQSDDGSDEIELITPGEPAVDDSGPPVDFRLEDLDRDYVEPASEREQEEQELRRSFELYKAALSASSFGEADTLAKRIVETSIRLYGLESYDSARALTNLGIVQHRGEDYESALLNYQAAIDIIERIGDRLNMELVNPLKGLGAAQLASGRPDLAQKTFGRAVHVSHVNEGPHNLMQIEILDAMTETHLSVGDVDEALDTQEVVYNLQTRRVGRNSDELLAVLQRQANWMHRLQYYTRERLAYRQMIRIIEKTHGKKDIALIGPLTGLGKSYLYTEPYDPEFQTYQPATGGEVYLKRALRIAEDHEESNWEIMRDALLALGDFYTLAAIPNRARRTYIEAWELLSLDEERLPSRRQSLQTTLVLQSITPPKYFNSERTDDGTHAPDSFEKGNIVVGFTVTDYGHTSKIAVIEAQPPGLERMERTVLREVRDLRYRPRIVDGHTVPIEDMTYSHDFFYHPSDLPDNMAESEFAMDQAQR